jgi:hypothetical protein
MIASRASYRRGTRHLHLFLDLMPTFVQALLPDRHVDSQRGRDDGKDQDHGPLWQ